MVVNWHWGRCFFPQVFALIFVCRKFDLIGSGIIRNPLSNQLYFYRAWLYLKPICKNWLTHHRLVDELHPQILKQKCICLKIQELGCGFSTSLSIIPGRCYHTVGHYPRHARLSPTSIFAKKFSMANLYTSDKTDRHQERWGMKKCKRKGKK